MLDKTYVVVETQFPADDVLAVIESMNKVLCFESTVDGAEFLIESVLEKVKRDFEERTGEFPGKIALQLRFIRSATETNGQMSEISFAGKPIARITFPDAEAFLIAGDLLNFIETIIVYEYQQNVVIPAQKAEWANISPYLARHLE